MVGPAEFLTGGGIDIRPHPHIGLATVTYLYKGAFEHRDSTGAHQIVHPGAVNWMIAGNGVTHSERTSLEMRQRPGSLFGIQTWVALPEAEEDRAASFEHHGKAALPFLEAEGKQVRLILGHAWGATAPVKTFSETFYADVVLAPGAVLPIPDEHEDRGVYVVEGAVTVAGDTFEAGRMMIFRPGDRISLSAGPQGARLMALGGATMGGGRAMCRGTSSPRRAKRSRRRKRPESKAIGTTAVSACPPVMRPKSFRCPRRCSRSPEQASTVRVLARIKSWTVKASA